MKKSRLILGSLAFALVLALATASFAKVTYYYFESIVNCNDGGGWVVVSENEDGSAHIDILCDGGSVG